MRTAHLSMSKVFPDPNQPRQHPPQQGVTSLAQSIGELGQQQPIIVYQDGDNFTIVDGHCRFAAQLERKADMIWAAVLEQKPDPDTLLLTQLAVNCLRSDLKPTDKARAFQRLKESKGWSNVQLATALHVSKSTVTQIMSFLTLPPDAQASLDAGELAPSTAYAVARAKNSEAQTEMLEEAKQGNLKRDTAVAAVRRNPLQTPKKVRLTFDLGEVLVTVSCEAALDVSTFTTVVQRLSNQCRRAVKEGWNIKTLVQVLHDETDKSKLIVTS